MAGAAEAGGFITMATGIPTDADTAWYCAVNASAGEWEIALGTRSSSTVLARPATPLASSNAGAKVNFSAAPLVFSSVPGQEIVQRTSKISVYRNASGTSGTGWQNVPVDTVEYDTDSIWDAANSRIQPKKPGYYEFIVSVRLSSTAAVSITVLKNGSTTGNRWGEYATTSGVQGAVRMYANGTTDYFTLYAYIGTARSWVTGPGDCFISAVGPL